MTRPTSSSLAHFIPPRQPHPLLVNFLGICQAQSISDFLFIQTRDQLSPLTDPNLCDTAYLFDVAMTRVRPSTCYPDPNNPKSTPDDSHCIESRFLFVPSYTLGHITVGIGVTEAFRTLPLPVNNQLAAPSMMFNTRFVFDASTHTSLVVIEPPEQDLFLIYYVHHPSPTRCTAISARISRSTFLDTIKPNPTSLTFQDILPHFIYLISDSLCRPCLVCNAPFSEQCSCTFPPIPSHHFRQAMQQTHGCFEGIASSLPIPSVTTLSLPAPQIPFGVSHNYNKHVPMRFMHKLRFWGLSTSSIADPRDSVQLSCHGDDPHDTCDAQFERNTAMAIAKARDLNVCNSHAEAILAELLATLAEPAARDDNTAMTGREFVLWLGDEQRGTAETMESPNRRWERQEYEPPPRTSARPSRGVRWEDREGGPMRNEPSLSPERETGSASSAATVTAETHDGKQGRHGSERIEGVDVRGELLAGTKTPEEVAAIVREMKAEERRIRNRESAHRSNQRKRALRALLEHEVFQERRRVCELRMRERTLQEENKRLRKRIEES